MSFLLSKPNTCESYIFIFFKPQMWFSEQNGGWWKVLVISTSDNTKTTLLYITEEISVVHCY